MGFIGIVQVEDGKDRTGSGMIVHEDGSVDVNVKNTTVPVNVQGLPLPVEVQNPVTISGCICAIAGASTIDVVSATATTSSQKIRDAETRFGIRIKNTHATSTVFIDFGTGGATLGTSFPIGPGETFEFPSGVAADDEIHVIGQSGGENLRLIVYR